mmetsp:Transcript_11305/g.20769  ORF Transcript_11305/g.20769 Transcript_11305/m.20769 type:complete len:115 (-) Transcript_11305:157-501(-)|eukprot:CAMPEP_0197525156 /NCGR_PEP_ID=MMETSP1318-20131121/10654_1 /TAXON_ID=552666 /ORGANISM="Partenskyella glossopodia, Strain RCC365" /LENGTH=114 /DNA_ID=CAMNT_0043078331 /DNA_START=40 /DNA_END=384 /DNA_ORIENTATION=+
MNSPTERNWRFYAANCAAVGLLVSAIRFPLRACGDNLLTTSSAELELGSVVMLMNRLPMAGLIGMAAATLVGALTVKEELPAAENKFPVYMKLTYVGSAGLLCLALFADKRGFF